MWSPQHFIEAGLARGIDEALLERASNEIETFVAHNAQLPALLTLGHLAQRTRSDYQELRGLIGTSRQSSYHHFRIRKRSGGHRLISVPDQQLMIVQRWINAHILNLLPVHHCSFAFKPKSSIVGCAAQHCGARWLIKMDVSGFFGSISEIQVYRVFRSAGYQPLIAFELARLTTYIFPKSSRYSKPTWQARDGSNPIAAYANQKIGCLPQGAPTSPMLSNLIMRECDAQINEIAVKRGVRYTRYSDDITFSTRKEFDRKQAKALIHEVSRVLKKIGFRPNSQKTVVAPPGSRKIVLGLLVDGIRPRLSREFRSRLRQHLYYLELFGATAHAKRRGFDSIWGMYNHIRGQIDFAKMVDSKFASVMRIKLDNVSWPSELSSGSSA